MNLSAGVCARGAGADRSTGVVGMADVRVLRSGDCGGLIGVILGNGKAEVKAPPAEDPEVLLPQLELKLPPSKSCSSNPRTVNKRVKRSAFIA